MFFTNFSTNFSQFEQLKKKTNFSLVQNSFFFFSVCQLKKKSTQIVVKKFRRFWIQHLWNYLMNSLMYQFSLTCLRIHFSPIYNSIRWIKGNKGVRAIITFYAGTVEHTGAVGIRPNQILAATLTLFQPEGQILPTI